MYVGGLHSTKQSDCVTRRQKETVMVTSYTGTEKVTVHAKIFRLYKIFSGHKLLFAEFFSRVCSFLKLLRYKKSS
jgi:hypothetical protein